MNLWRRNNDCCADYIWINGCYCSTNPVSFEIISFIHGYKKFQRRDDDFLDYATIDYSTLKRLYQINPDGYKLSNFGQLYRMNNSHGLVTREVRIVCGCLIPEDKYETHYQVTIDDSVSMNEFQDKYEIIEVEGKIYTVRERVD